MNNSIDLNIKEKIQEEFSMEKHCKLEKDEKVVFLWDNLCSHSSDGCNNIVCNNHGEKGKTNIKKLNVIARTPVKSTNIITVYI